MMVSPEPQNNCHPTRQSARHKLRWLAGRDLLCFPCHVAPDPSVAEEMSFSGYLQRQFHSQVPPSGCLESSVFRESVNTQLSFRMQT